MKRIIRQKILKQRRNLKPLIKEGLDQKILKKLYSHPLFKKAKIIFLYVSIPDEVSTFGIIKKYPGKKHLIVPRVQGKHRLSLREIQNLKHLERRAFGILEPKTHLPKIKPDKIELAIVPGIAFDKRGHRIGYGRGYMDRLFTKMKCPKIGLAYDFQMVDKIPEGPYDVPVDLVITEKYVYATNTGSATVRPA